MTAEDKLAKKQKAEVTRRAEPQAYFQPAVNICETGGELIVTFDMPGVSRDNVDITVDKEKLTVLGKADPEQAGRPVYRETRVGDYRREFTLTEDVNAERISAEMAAGLLTLKIPKAEKARPKKIQIQAAG